MLETFKMRLERNTIPTTESGCWLWTGYLASIGYGAFEADQKQYYAHRVSYEAYKGEVPGGYCVLHRCDVPSCVNPDHLFLGTKGDNNSDRHLKGRTKTLFMCGELHPSIKVTDDQALEIRHKYSTGKYTQQLLADIYGISTPCVNQIINMKGRFKNV